MYTLTECLCNVNVNANECTDNNVFQFVSLFCCFESEYNDTQWSVYQQCLIIFSEL